LTAISLPDRNHAGNSIAYFYEKPITIEEYQNSAWIAEPLRLVDCCQKIDGAAANVVTRAIEATAVHDHFSPFTVIQLEELDSAANEKRQTSSPTTRSRSAGVCRSIPRRPARRGRHPRHERHRRARGLRGTSVNRAFDVEHILVTAGTVVPTSGLVLG
jgi:hypothetical protein